MTPRSRALIYAIFALFVGGAAYLLGVGSFIGQQAEASVLEASDFDPDPAGPLELVTPVNLAIALLVIGFIALWTHGIARTLSILTASSVAILVSQLLKERWLERPQLFEVDAANTFPSGHMAVYAVLIGALVWAVPRGLRFLVMMGAAILLSVVSWQLLEYGWHRPSDLIGAQALAVCVFALAACIGPRKTRRRRPNTVPVLVMLNHSVSIVLTVAGIALTVGALVLAVIATSTRSDQLLLLSGEISLFGVSALTVRTLAKLSP